MDNMEVGTKIRFYREQRGLNRNALANAAGVSPTYIYQLERGQKSPTVEYLGYICDALGLTLGEFFGDKDKAPMGAVGDLTQQQQECLNAFLNSLK